MRLIPRDEGFFDLFGELARRVTSSSKLLSELFVHPDRLEHYSNEIKKIEHEADELTRQVIARLDASFVTPMDREDIHLLAYRLDNVIDLVDGTARRAQMFRIKEIREPAHRLADVLNRAAIVIERAVADVRRRPEVVKFGQEVKRLEEEGDQEYAQAVGDLFDGQPDALEVIKWKEIYDKIEAAIDECEDVSNVLESISLKNS